MTKQNVSNYEIMSALFPSVPPTWDRRISLASRQLWESTKILLTSDEFQVTRNEIFDALVNRIALTKIKHKQFTNPMSMFFKGTMPFGDTLQEISTDVLKEERFEGTKNVDQFEVFKNDVKAVYHKINRESVYPVTIGDQRMKRAFLNENGLQALIAEIMNQMGSSNTLDEFIYCKKLISAYYENSSYPLLPTQKIVVPDIAVKANKTKDNMDEFIERIKIVMRRMAFPSRDYTSSQVMAQCKPENMTCFMKVEYTVINEVNNLSSAFNPEYLNINVPIIGVDDFGKEHEEIIGVIMDNDAAEIYNTLQLVTSSENARGLYRNYFYHIQQLYSLSPFENVVYITK